MKNNSNQLIKYKEETFFSKIKRKFLSLFKGKKVDTQGVSAVDIKKQDFFELYAKVKRHEVDLATLDKKTLYRIIKMLDEEIEITNKLAEDKLEQISNGITDMKIFAREMELMKENP